MCRAGKIVKRIHRSPFSEIYLLIEEDRKEVLKRHTIKLADEALFLNRLKGVYTPKLFEYNKDSLVMEYIEGVNLYKYAPSISSLCFTKKLEIIRRIARVYLFFHEQGILHLDPNPGNIFVCPDGSIKVVDFHISTTIKKPQAYLNIRKIPFMNYMIRPPESFNSNFIPDVKAEIYAIGHLFYFIEKGQFLFEEYKSSYTFKNRREAKRMFHENINSTQLPSNPLYEIITFMIQNERHRRPQSMLEIVHALQTIKNI